MMGYKNRVFLVLITVLLVGFGIFETKEVVGNNRNESVLLYEIVESEYANAGIVIHYPQITNLGDSFKQYEVNRLLKEEALAVLNNYNEDEISSELSLDIDFDIMWQGQRLLSVRYLGDGYLDGTAHPFNLFYTTNINVVTGTKVRIKELVTIDDAFLSKFLQARYKPWHSAMNLAEDGTIDLALTEWFSVYDLIEYINKRDSSDNYLTFWYLTEKSLGISLRIPHVIGDHMEFEMDYKDLGSNLITENELWKDFSI